MAENPPPNEVVMPGKKSSEFPRWLLIVLPVALIGICCLVIFIVVPKVLKVNVSGGGYSIESVTLSTGLENGQPVGVKDVFMPSDTINCTVKTSGIKDGIIGMRWYSGENKIYEVTGKTQNNIFSTYIKSTYSAVIPEGKYRVEIFMTGETLDTAYFEVKNYHPKVNPPISIPEGHINIETPWYPEVPFAFDEVWNIDGTKWKINEVKVILIDESQEYFVAVVVASYIKDMFSISEEEAKAKTRGIALYAIENNYVAKAKSLEIDGKHYQLDKGIYVILKNPSTQQSYRIPFSMDELK